jgi:hypothetical protein
MQSSRSQRSCVPEPTESGGSRPAKANLDQHLVTSTITRQERTAEGRLTGAPPTTTARFNETKIFRIHYYFTIMILASIG